MGDGTAYLDSAATSLTPDCVLEKVNRYYRYYNANIHRGIHNWAEKATVEYEEVRPIVGDFIQMGTSTVKDCELVFSSGTTHGINLVANSFCADWDSDDRVIISEAEHHANKKKKKKKKKKRGTKKKKKKEKMQRKKEIK